MKLSLCLFYGASLAFALPQSGGPVTPSLNISDPSSADPITPPKGPLNLPPAIPNPWADGGIPQIPDACTDPSNPSDECFKALAAQPGGDVQIFGRLTHDGSCSLERKQQIDTAFYEAYTLANFAKGWPKDARGAAAADFYMGPDYPSQQQRIKDNFKRAASFLPTTNNYITVSCKDSKNECGKGAGTTVGGYAWTYSGWFGYYYYITLCPTFFTASNVSTILQLREEDLAAGNTNTVTDMRYFRTTGQMFLHEMMHLDLIGNPHIADQKVEDQITAHKAYGPKLVHKLAANAPNKGGGAAVSSINADSYAMLANAIYWWDVTTYFPGVPNKNNPKDPDDTALDQGPIFLNLDLGNVTNTSSVDFASLFNAAFDQFENNTSPASPSPPSPSSTSPPASSPTAASQPTTAADKCGDEYKFFFDSFQIQGRNFNAAKFGDDGSGLKKQIQGCGDLTDWKFKKTPNDPTYQWSASGRLPIGTKACVGRAVVSAGGSSPDGCTGAG